MREVEGIEFNDGFVGEEQYGYHLSPDGLHLLQDYWDEVSSKALETDLYVYFYREDCVVMFDKNDEGVIGDVVSNNYFASVGLTESLEQIWTGAGEESLVWADGPTRQYLREFASDYDWTTKTWDTKDVAFTEVIILGKHALYTDHELIGSSVPKSLHKYEVRHTDGDFLKPAQIVKEAYGNRQGTLLTTRPLDLFSPELQKLNLEEALFPPGKPKSLDEFMKERGVKAKKPKSFER